MTKSFLQTPYPPSTGHATDLPSRRAGLDQKATQAAVAELVQANWVRKVRKRQTGRPAERYEVNPQIWDETG